MAQARTVPKHMSAGVILVDRQGRVLMQLRDDNPEIMFPGHWGLTGGASLPGETPEQTALREVTEETGLTLDRFEAFRAYYFAESGPRRPRIEYELYLFHAPCDTPADTMTCGEGSGLRFLGPPEIETLDIAYNHREVLADFFATAAYARYVSGAAFDDAARVHPLDRFRADLENGTPWFDALMDAIAAWETPVERVDDREYRYLVGGEAFDWLLLAERLIEQAGDAVTPAEAQALLFHGRAPGPGERRIEDDQLRRLIGETKHRAHLNFVYGVTTEEALQHAAELQIAKERSHVSIRDARDGDEARDAVFERIYGHPRTELLAEFRTDAGLPHQPVMSLAELREFTYWLFKYRVKNSEPARVASDTRRALAQLSAMEDAVRRSRLPQTSGQPSV